MQETAALRTRVPPARRGLSSRSRLPLMKIEHTRCQIVDMARLNHSGVSRFQGAELESLFKGNPITRLVRSATLRQLR